METFEAVTFSKKRLLLLLNEFMASSDSLHTDTLSIVQELTAAGMPRDLAEKQTRIWNQNFQAFELKIQKEKEQLSTKDDLNYATLSLRKDMEEMRLTLQKEIETVRLTLQKRWSWRKTKRFMG